MAQSKKCSVKVERAYLTMNGISPSRMEPCGSTLLPNGECARHYPNGTERPYAEQRPLWKELAKAKREARLAAKR